MRKLYIGISTLFVINLYFVINPPDKNTITVSFIIFDEITECFQSGLSHILFEMPSQP
jgi:hypothetical protein